VIYSCFNARLGLYEYFKDHRHHPLNGDLPVPVFGAVAGEVGIPALDAGRQLPADAVPTGTGWSAKGMIVNCKNVSVAGLSGLGYEDLKTNELFYIVMATGLGYAGADRARENPFLGAILAGGLGYVIVAYGRSLKS